MAPCERSCARSSSRSRDRSRRPGHGVIPSRPAPVRSDSIQSTRRTSSASTVRVIWSASEHAAASADCFWSGDGSGKLSVWTA